MSGCIAEDDLLELARGERALADAPELEAHLADCAACSALLAELAAAAPVARRDLAGTMLGPYRLEGLIGAGAMGEIYRAWDTRLERHVALKALGAAFAASPERVRRLEAEARAAAAIAHPNVVTVYDTGTAGGVPYLVSELIHGENLRSVIDRGPVPRRTALDLAAQLARGLAAAHAGGVVHRDLKPQNMLVTADGTLKILDFGLAKQSGPRDAEATQPGTLLGTAGYLSPEQARGESADARSDLFAAGAVIYELLSGRRAFGGATFAERLSAVLRDTPPALDDPAGAVVERCLEKDPKKRFQSAGDLAWTLEGLIAGGVAAPARLSRRGFVAAVAAAGAGGLALGRWLAPARTAAAPEFRQLTFRQGRVASARFTADGGSVLHSAAWDGDPLATFTARLAGGGTRPLDLPSAQLLAVSARGQLALSLGHRFIEGFHQRGQLAVAPLEGGAPRPLGLEVQDADFRPDGELCVVRRAGKGFRLESPPGRVLLEGGWLSHPRVAPDGKRVACLVHEDPADDRGAVVLVPAEGGAARRIGPDWSSIDGLAWAPGGGALWVSASREGGNNAARRLDLDGREVARVPSAGRLRVHDVAADGTLAVSHTSGRVRMMVRAPGAAAEADLALSDVCLVADIAADGESVAFAAFGDSDTGTGAYLRPSRGGPALRVGEGFPLDLADDGRGLLLLPFGESLPVIVPAAAGQPRPLPPLALADVAWARWCAGGILLGGAAPGRPPRVWHLDSGGHLAPLTDEGVAGRAAVSPDGRRAALLAGDQLVVLQVGGGASTVVPGSYADERVCGWRAGGDEVLLRGVAPPIAIRRVGVAGGDWAPALEIDPPRLGRRGVVEVVVSEDGAAYAYSYGQELSRLFTMRV